MTTVPEFQPLPMKEPPPSPPGRHDVMMRSTFGRSDSFGSAFTTQNSFAAPRGMKDDPAEVCAAQGRIRVSIRVSYRSLSQQPRGVLTPSKYPGAPRMKPVGF